MANHTSPADLESSNLSDIDAEIHRLLSELNPFIQELARQTKELSDLKESYSRAKEAIRNRLFDVGIRRFDVRDLAAVHLQGQEVEGRVVEMLSLSDQCIAQIAKVIAAIHVKNKKQSSSEEVGGSKLGNSSTSIDDDDDDDDDLLGLSQKCSTDLEIGKEDLENAQVILTEAELSIQDVQGLQVSADGVNVSDTKDEPMGTDANRGGNDASTSTRSNGEYLSEVVCLENRMADFDIEEEGMENTEEMNVDSDGKIKLKRKNEEDDDDDDDDDDDQKKPTKSKKLKDQNPIARDLH